MKPDDIVDLGMIEVHYLRMYNSSYGDNSPNVELMFKAQRECFENENMGSLVSEKTMQTLVGDNDTHYPILGRGTSVKEFNEARYVMSTNPCTRLDLERCRMFENGHLSDEYDDDGSNRLCFFCISNDAGVKPDDIVDLGMMDARYLRMDNSSYGDNSLNGELMYKA